MICKPCATDADIQGESIRLGEEFSLIPVDQSHDACKGCDCQHKPVKEGQITGE